MKRGDVALAMNGKSYVLHYGWPQVEKLVDKFGQSFDSVIATASANYDLPVLAFTLSVGLEARNDEIITPEQIMDISPPMIQTIKALNDSIMVAFYGQPEMPEELEKKTPIRTWMVNMIRKLLMI